MADDLTKEQRHKNMKNIHGKDTKIEVILRKALWNKGYRSTICNFHRVTASAHPTTFRKKSPGFSEKSANPVAVCRKI